MVMGELPFFAVLFYYHDHFSLSPSLPPNSNRYIWTDLTAEGATRAGLMIITNDKEIPLTVYFFSHPDQLLGT